MICVGKLIIIGSDIFFSIELFIDIRSRFNNNTSTETIKFHKLSMFYLNRSMSPKFILMNSGLRENVSLLIWKVENHLMLTDLAANILIITLSTDYDTIAESVMVPKKYTKKYKNGHTGLWINCMPRMNFARRFECESIKLFLMWPEDVKYLWKVGELLIWYGHCVSCVGKFLTQSNTYIRFRWDRHHSSE